MGTAVFCNLVSINVRLNVTHFVSKSGLTY